MYVRMSNGGNAKRSQEKNSNEEKKKRCYMMGGGCYGECRYQTSLVVLFSFLFFFVFFATVSFLFVNLSGLIHKISIPSSLGSEMLLEQHLLV